MLSADVISLVHPTTPRSRPGRSPKRPSCLGLAYTDPSLTTPIDTCQSQTGRGFSGTSVPLRIDSRKVRVATVRWRRHGVPQQLGCWRPGRSARAGSFKSMLTPSHTPRRSMYAIYAYIGDHWGGLRGQCSHIWQSHGVSRVL